jgi:SAM-dependent methyltransferase
MTEKPSPSQIFAALNAYQLSAALRGAIELRMFDAVGPAGASAETIASRCSLPLRGVRILADYLVVHSFLEKNAGQYRLMPASATYLVSTSPDYMGDAVTFFHSPRLQEAFQNVAASVRRGGTALEDGGSVAPEHPMWIQFAVGMGAVMREPAKLLAQCITLSRDLPLEVLDIAASHGEFGFAVLREFPRARLTALDWQNVLDITKRNAENAGLGTRVSTVAGNAFDAPLTRKFDIVLVPNFLHHFNAQTCTKLLRRLRESMNPGGEILILEFVPNEDRVTPPGSAAFALIMLCTTPDGDAYTYEELQRMLTAAGFKDVSARQLGAGMEMAVLARA